MAILTMRQETVLFVSALLHRERQRRGTRAGTRCLSCFAQALLIIRWFLDGTRVAQLDGDNTISASTCYEYLHEGIDLLAAQAPSLESALLAAKMAGYGHVNIDGTLIETDRCRAPGRTAGVDLFWSGKHDTITIAYKRPADTELSDIHKTYNKIHNGVRAIGERGNSLLKMTFKAVRNVSLCPWAIGRIVAAALVLLHIDHGRTT